MEKFEEISEDEELLEYLQSFRLTTPCFLVHYNKMVRNCQRMIAKAEQLGVTLRPHIKTHKTHEGALIQLFGTENLETIQAKHDPNRSLKIVVSTLEEARFFSQLKNPIIDDILYGIPLSPNKFEVASQLLKQIPKFGIFLDTEQAMKALDEYSRKNNLEKKWNVFVKIDCGYHRAGINPEDPKSVELIQAIVALKTMEFQGIYSHSGHSYNVTNAEGAKQVAEQERQVMEKFMLKLKTIGIVCPSVGVGATPSISNVANLQGCTEIHPGNYIFYDRFQATIGSCSLDDVACSVVATVISQYPDRGRLLIDAGALALSKDIGATSGKDWGLVRGSKNKHLKIISLSQETGIIESDGSKPINFEEYAVGTKLLIIPNHSCLTNACFSYQYIYRNGKIDTTWKTCNRDW